LQDYLLGLHELHGAHSGANIASHAGTVLRAFCVDGGRLGYFVLNNASSNNTVMVTLASEFGFDPAHWQLRCCAHILNFGAQVVVWGKDRDALENNGAGLGDEEKFMEEWRKFGLVGVLFDVIAARQLFEQLQHSSYYQTFDRAVKLHGPIDTYVELKLEEHHRTDALTKRKRSRNSANDQQYNSMSQQKRLYIRERGLSSKDWTTISEYINLLERFYKATKSIKGRGKHGSHGAIWEVLIIFE
jgi:hypothetical protein